MTDKLTSIDDLIVLVSTCVATGESYVVPDDTFVKMMFTRAPERERLFNPNNHEVDGYVSFTAAMLDGSLGNRLEHIQSGLNERWACWDPASSCFDTSQTPDVIDVYSFVNANCLNRDAFASNPFITEQPAGFDDLWERPSGREKVAELTEVRKPWLL